MKAVANFTIIVGMLYLMFGAPLSAVADDLQRSTDDRGFSDSVGTEAFPMGFGEKSPSLAGSEGGEAAETKEITDPKALEELRKVYEKGQAGEEVKTTGEAPRKMPKILLRIEPGDGLAALSCHRRFTTLLSLPLVRSE